MRSFGTISLVNQGSESVPYPWVTGELVLLSDLEHRGEVFCEKIRGRGLNLGFPLYSATTFSRSVRFRILNACAAA